MAAKGYCTAALVAAFLGKTFTTDQTTQANSLIERAEAYIDNQTGRGWLVGAQTDEAHFLGQKPWVFLRYTPVQEITAVTGRTAPGEDEAALTLDEDYEVRDLETGLIRLLVSGYDRILVDYTPVATVPGDLVQAAIELVTNWLQPSLQPGTYGLDSYSLPDLTVRFSRAHVQEVVPPTVQQVIDSYRYRVHA